MSDRSERRKFPRIKTPVFCRPTGVGLFRYVDDRGQPVVDLSMGGARIYSDEDVALHTPLELELFLPDGSSIVGRAEVAWTEALPPGSPAKFDVGLRFTELSPLDHDKLELVLEDGEPAD